MDKTRKKKPNPALGQAKPRSLAATPERPPIEPDKGMERQADPMPVSEEKFRRLFETVQDGIFLVDAATGVIIEANPFVEKTLGYTQVEMAGKKLWEIGPLKNIFANQEAFRELKKKKTVHYENLSLVSRDGRHFQVEFVSNAYQVGGQRVIQCNIRDNTGRLRAEEATSRANRVYAVISQINQMIVRTHDQDEIFAEACRIAIKDGKFCMAWVGLIDEKNQVVKPVAWDGVEQGYLTQIKTISSRDTSQGRGPTGTAVRERKTVYCDDIANDPRMAPWREEALKRGYRASIALPMIVHGRVIGAFTIYATEPFFFDETEIRLLEEVTGNIAFALEAKENEKKGKQAEEEIRKLNAELEQCVEARTRELREAQEKLVRQEKLAMLGQLAGSVGHELRNPLGIINNAAYYLRLIQPEMDEKVKEYLGIIEHETRTADKIITDLLDFSRIKSVDKETVQVAELIEESFQRFPAPENVSVEIELSKDLPSLQVDLRQMTQVLGNLIVNACQAMASHGSAKGVSKSGKLIITATRKGKEVILAVKDTGAGIPPENMSKLFEPLFTTKLKGIGLGLAVSKKLVEANDGRIEVFSEPGKGSTFSVFLPVDEDGA